MSLPYDRALRYPSSMLWTDSNIRALGRPGKGGAERSMKWEVKGTVSGEELTRALRGVTWDGLASKTTITLTSGAFLVAFALQLGAF